MSTQPDTTAPDVSTAAYAAVEKASASLRSFHVPSILEEAAALLADLWAAGEKHGVPPKEWGWAVNLASGALEVISSRYTQTPDPERTNEQVFALQRDLIEALTSTEIGLTARLGSRAMVIVDRLPETPRGGFHGDANLAVGLYTNGGWDISMDADGASVLSIVAPATKAGASQVAEIVRAVARGEHGNPFRSR
ncbi:hypothetical protein ACFU7X_18190 [Streptomyces chartreusis]|uniref:hypothetical protein n=1 Tax=Streptomyces chartreusis TaxID=1969 RepID=UPI0036B44821